LYETEDNSGEQLSVLKFTVGYNKSDFTGGFSGLQNTFDVYYLHYTLEKSAHSDGGGRTYTLSSIMTPKVLIGLQTTRYLGPVL